MWRWTLVLLVVARAACAAEAPPLLALIVSNSAYQTLPALSSCQASATVVAASLSRAGWIVTQLRDPSNGQLGAGVASFTETVAKAPGANALVYACGYAAAFENRLFLLPASARLARETDTLTEGVVLPALTGVLSRAELGAGLIVVDLMALPGKSALPTETAARRGLGPHTGLFVAAAAAPEPDGPTITAATLATALAERDLPVGKVLTRLGDALTAVGGHTFVQPPTDEAWLAGGPPPPLPQPPVATPPEPPVPPAPAPAPVPAAIDTLDSAATLGDLDRRRVQLALQRLGYYAGRVDGTFGPESLAAIRRYQHELGAEMNGRLTDEQAARLLATP